MNEVKLPELGENIDSVEVSALLVAEGDRIRRDQPVIEVETEKASLEVPSPVAGRVSKLLVRAGEAIRVGQTILLVEDAADAAEAEARDSSTAPAAAATADPGPPPEEPAAEPPPPPPPAAAEPKPSAPTRRPEPAGAARPARAGAAVPRVPAAPNVRALARELGIDIAEVRGTGAAGRISREDVKAHAKRIIQGREVPPAAAPPTGGAAPTLPDFAQWGPVRRERLSSVRRVTAAAMAAAWAQVPHVTQFDRADITELEALRRGFNRRPEVEGRKLTVTALGIKVAAAALRRFPVVNASLDAAANEVIYKDYVHVGVAVDTERGLLVPVLRDADRKGLLQVVDELEDLAQRARSKKLAPEEMRGASFTISNLGGLGTTYFAPIVPWPQSAILGLGRAEARAALREGKLEPRIVLPLSVSYDHRLIDGADAARFLRWIAEALEQPLLLLVEEGR